MRVITAAELDEMTPAERESLFRSGIIRDLADVPPQYQHVIEEQRRRILENEARRRQAS